MKPNHIKYMLFEIWRGNGLFDLSSDVPVRSMTFLIHLFQAKWK